MRNWAWIAIAFLVAATLCQITFPFDRLGIQYPQCLDPDPHIPDVLLIGDSTQIRYFPLVKEGLKGQANVCRMVELAPQRIYSLVYGGPLVQPVNAKSTAEGLRRLNGWLNSPHWDVIHFNWGLHDLGKSGDGSGVQEAGESAVQTYRNRMELLIGQLKPTEARLILATTTPVPENLGYVPGEVEAFNVVAKSLALENHVLVNDLHAAVLDHVHAFLEPDSVHFNEAGNQLLATATVSSILTALDSQAASGTHAN